MSSRLFVIIVCCCFLGGIAYQSCLLYNPDREDMGKTYEEQSWTPASVCEYEVRFISTSTYKTLEDFWDAVGRTVTYLNNNGYKVFDIIPKYGRDMTRKRELKFVYIKYLKEVKNENETKGRN